MRAQSPSYVSAAVSRILVAAIAIACLQALAPARASAGTQLVFEYRIEHPTYGDIGTFINRITKAGTTTDVQTSVRVAVKFFGATVYREISDRTERWLGDRLVAFHGVTDKDGERFEVNGQAQGGKFVVTGRDGTFTAPADVQPPNPWSASCLKADTMLSSVSGRVFAAHVIDRGEDLVTVAGQKYRAHKYEVDTDRPHTVWFDDRGLPLQIESIERGDPVRLVLTHYPDEMQALASVPAR